jgi:hypothetical protein
MIYKLANNLYNNTLWYVVIGTPYDNICVIIPTTQTQRYSSLRVTNVYQYYYEVSIIMFNITLRDVKISTQLWIWQLSPTIQNGVTYQVIRCLKTLTWFLQTYTQQVSRLVYHSQVCVFRRTSVISYCVFKEYISSNELYRVIKMYLCTWQFYYNHHICRGFLITL